MNRLIIALNFLMFVALLSLAVISNAEATEFKKFVGAPKQHVQFCKAFPNHCVAIGTQDRARFTIDTLAKLEHVNNWTHRRLKQVEDAKGHENDHWTMPITQGDCEDHAIFKRAYLLAEGFSSSQLLMTVVWSPSTSWHAILTVRTDAGDYVLDNRFKGIKSVEETIVEDGYVYFWRQSIVDPKKWVELKSADYSKLPASYR